MKDFRRLKRGVYYPFKIVRPAKVRSAYSDLNITKVTKTVGRVGIRYSHLSQTIEEKGGIQEDPLQWGEWEDYPFYIRHKGKRYCRVYANLGQTRSHFVMDGRIVKKADIQHMLLSSELQEREAPSRGILPLSVTEERLKVL